MSSAVVVLVSPREVPLLVGQDRVVDRVELAVAAPPHGHREGRRRVRPGGPDLVDELPAVHGRALAVLLTPSPRGRALLPGAGGGQPEVEATRTAPRPLNRGTGEE